MNNYELRRSERTSDIIFELIAKNDKIANIVQQAYDRGYADGKRVAEENKPHIKITIDGEQVYPTVKEQEIENNKCGNCIHYGETSVTGNCIKCIDFDRYER